jgi:integrase
MIGGKSRSMGLGHANDVSLVEARNKADAARKLLREGVDPLNERDAVRTAAIVAKARAVTFSEVADRYITAKQAGWRSDKFRADWRATLGNYVEPVIGALPLEAVDTNLILQILEPIWQSKSETASRVRGRIEMILSYAIARGWRDGPNPAMWRGHLQLMLPPPRKVHPVVHRPALDWHDAPNFMATLRRQDTVGAGALQFTILTAARSGEVRDATWNEVDMERGTWTVPAGRMKGGREQRVPLSQPALEVLQSMWLLRTGNGPLFPGRKLKQGSARI